jgi:uncharacterized protein (DUF983 family)
MRDIDFDEDETATVGTPKRGTHFECPECTAYNPYDDGFIVGDDVICNYCGTEFKVADGNGKFKFKAT